MEAEGVFQFRQHLSKACRVNQGPYPKDKQACQEGENGEEQAGGGH